MDDRKEAVVVGLTFAIIVMLFFGFLYWVTRCDEYIQVDGMECTGTEYHKTCHPAKVWVCKE